MNQFKAPIVVESEAILPKAFLSHSSSDKSSYVHHVFRLLGSSKAIIDDQTFEEGMPPLEEILRCLDMTDLFVLFISDKSLSSEWVRREVLEARDLHASGKIRRIFPIIIDPSVTYKDPRVPDWMKKDYNVQLINRPKVAARRIEQRLREISWDMHPRIREREQLFVGRNDLIKSFEERNDSIVQESVAAVIASGIRSIGRRSLLLHCLRKGNVVLQSYSAPTISMDSSDSIDEFCLKVYDLGFSAEMALDGLINLDVEAKIEIAKKLIGDMALAHEVLFVIDEGAIISQDRMISAWFVQLVDGLSEIDRPIVAVASRYRPNRGHLHGYERFFAMDVPELELTERIGLFKRYANMEGISLTTDEVRYFSDLLNGYPEQVFFAVNLIHDQGIQYAKENTDLIRGYNSERVSILLSTYEGDEKALNFLYLLSNFDFVHYDLLLEIEGDEDFCRRMLGELLAAAICEQLGATREYYRLNDAVRDYISRNRLKLSDFHRERLHRHVKSFLQNYRPDDYVVADFLYSLKEGLVEGLDIDDRYLVPSHFVKTIREVYSVKRNFDEVVKLADRVLQKSSHIDPRVIREIRYYLCLSLARTRSPRFQAEVQNMDGADHDFLLGFYYRRIGKSAQAIERLTRALTLKPAFPNARGELVQAYLNLEDYDKALAHARQNYDLNKKNAFNIHAYIRSLIGSPDRADSADYIESLIDELGQLGFDKAKEMHLTSLAEFIAFFEGDEVRSMSVIDEAVARFPDSIYPKISYFRIAERFNSISEMEKAICLVDKEVDDHSQFYSTLVRMKALLMARKGDREGAISLIKSIRNYPEDYLDRMIAKINRV